MNLSELGDITDSVYDVGASLPKMTIRKVTDFCIVYPAMKDPRMSGRTPTISGKRGSDQRGRG